MREPTILENSVISLEWNFSEMRPLTGQCALLHGQRHQLLTRAMPTAPRGGNPALSIGFHIPSCSLFLFPRQTKPAPTIGLNFPLFPLSVLCLAAQSCPTLCSPMDCTPPSSSAHGAVQARILEWITLPSSRVSSVYSSPIYPQRHPDQLKTAPQSHT